MKPKFILTVLLVLAFVIPFALYTRSASAASVESPVARGYHQMTYDSESGLVILYGGQTGYWQDPTQSSYETWSFDPETNIWTERFPSVSPGGYSGGDMTYDSKSDRCILSVLSADFSTLQTWAYDANTTTWTRLADGPRRMVGQRIVYDSESDRIIMFGGFDLSNYKLVDETWVYDYNTNTWTNMDPRVHPSGRNYIGMVYDTKADRVVVWGDWQRNYTPATDESVWTYDFNTNTWQEFEHKKDGPAVRDYLMLAYDSKTDKIIMYGGYDFGDAETWMYDLNTDTWKQMQSESAPGLLSRYTMVYVRDINKTILFGGQDGATHFQYKGDTWSYTLKTNRWIKMYP